MIPPTSRSTCGDVNGSRLSDAACADTRNDAGCDVADLLEDRRRQRLEVVRPAARVGKVRDAEHAAQPLAHLFAGRVGPQLDLDPPHRRSYERDVQTGQRRLQIPHQQLNEPRPVLPLQRQLLVVNDDRVHQSGNR